MGGQEKRPANVANRTHYAPLGSYEKSNEIPAAQTLLAELGVAAGSVVTLDALHCQKNISKSPRKPTSP